MLNPIMFEPEKDDDDAVVSDIWAFLLTDPPASPEGGKVVLEVHQVVGDAVMDMLHFQPGQSVTVGSAVVRELRLGGVRLATLPAAAPLGEACWKQHFFVPSSMLPAEEHVLFEANGQGWSLRLDPRWVGFIDLDGIRTPLAQLPHAPGPDGLIRVPVEGRVVLDLGGPAFIAQKVSPGRRAAPPPVFELDGPMAASVLFMAAVATLVGTVISVAPPPPESGFNQKIPESILVLLQEPVKSQEPPAPEAGGASAKEPEGAAPKHPVNEPLPKRQIDRQRADAAGILAALREDDALAATLGDAGLSADLLSGTQALIGARNSSTGVGLGQRGGGLGGNGTADQVGGMGTIGRGGGSTGRYGPLDGRDGDGKRQGSIALNPEGVIQIGGMDRSVIDAVIKRNLAMIKHCYQRELTKVPSLSGRVTVKFIIAKDGSVSSATTKSSSLGSPAVEACINGRFMHMAFPESKGGGMVVVSYPFLFAPA